MKKFLVAVVATFILSCSNSKEFVDLVCSDYFPLDTGMVWTYLDREEREITREVVRDTLLGDEKAYIVEMAGEREFWATNSDEVSLYIEKYLYRGDYIIPAEQSFIPVLYLPPVAGFSVSDSVNKVCVLLGDSAYYSRKLTASISKYGERRFLYTLDILFENEGFEETLRERIIRTYILAPDTGPVYIKEVKYSGGDTIIEEYNLLEFRK